MRSMKSKLIKIKGDTVERLDAKKHPGQTYDGVIRELLDKEDSKKG
jgi:hypothetical protein